MIKIDMKMPECCLYCPFCGRIEYKPAGINNGDYFYKGVYYCQLHAFTKDILPRCKKNEECADYSLYYKALYSIDIKDAFEKRAKWCPLKEADVPYVMTLEEIKNSEAPLWLERKHSDGTVHGEWIVLNNQKQGDGYILLGSYCLFNSAMGILWRGWTGKPTQEQSEEVKWDEPFC